jgi:hypothetical protein
MSRNATRESVTQDATMEDMCIESVSDSGEVVVRFPAGWSMQLEIPPDLVRYYRRLIRR